MKGPLFPAAGRAVAAIALGAGIGAVFGILAYAAFMVVMTSQPVTLDLLMPTLGVTRAVFMAVGALFGIIVFGGAAGVLKTQRIMRLVFGTLVGGFAGLVLYSVGYVAANYPGIPRDRYYLLYFAEAYYSFTLIELFCILLGLAVGFMTVKYSWRFYGILTYISLVSVVAGYLVYSFTISLPTVPRSQLPLSILLIAAETASLTMVTVYAFYALDVFVRKGWRRSPDKVPFSKYYLPKVAFHLSMFNEPPELVIESLKKLLRIDYPADRFVIMVLDDSTDENSRKPVEDFCKEHHIRYIHRTKRGGFKAGALNNALKYTPPDVEIISVLDCDFQVEPEYLKETVGYFINPNLGFIQTPQDYRNKHQSFLTEQYYYADSYFYRAILPSRNEENAIIFCGTMGLIRRKVLEEVGGWGEDFICEDAELSVRVLCAGYDSLYINKTYGRGLVPATFEAYKKQQYRWSFGGVMILKRHLLKMLFSRLTLRQKIDFLIGGLHWFDGVYVVAIAGIVAVIALGDIFDLPLSTYHQREIWLIGLVPFFMMLDGITRLNMALKRSMNVRLSGTIKVMGIWFAIKFNNMFAALKCLVGYKIPFVRTPKAPDGRPTRWEAVRRSVILTKFETSMFLLLFTISCLSVWTLWTDLLATGKVYLTRLVLLFWLGYYCLIFLAAPLYAYKAYTTFTPDRDLFPTPAPAPAAEAGGKAG